MNLPVENSNDYTNQEYIGKNEEECNVVIPKSSGVIRIIDDEVVMIEDNK